VPDSSFPFPTFPGRAPSFLYDLASSGFREGFF
jgi:hypothetical protein